MVSQKYHTPFCAKNCKIEHHDLVTVLCLDSSQKSDELPDLLRECIESYSNWDHNSEVPDPLEELQCPLMYLASAFGKAGLVRALIQDNFDAHAVTSNGETALHGAVQYIYRTGSLKAQGLKVAATLGPIKNRRRAFERILVTLTDVDPKIMFVQDNDGDTAFHVAAEKIWNDRQNDRLGKSATFFQSCMSSMLNRMLELEETGEVTRVEILEALNMENNDGDTIFHILARDYAFGFKTMKEILKKFFPGQVPSKVNKENETVSSIALERNRKKAVQVFPEFLEQSRRKSRISSTSEPEISDSDSPSPSTSRDSEEFTTNGSANGEKPPDTSSRETPIIVVSETDCVPQVSHSIDEEENSSNELIAASKESVNDHVDVNTTPLPTNPGQHDLLTMSMDSNLGKPSQMEVPSFLSLSQKSNLIVSPFDSIISTPVVAGAMYVTETLTVNSDQHTLSEGERREVARKRSEASDTANQRNGSDPSDPKFPFTFTLSSSDSKATGASSKDPSGAPNEERVAKSPEENTPDEIGEPEQVESFEHEAPQSHRGKAIDSLQAKSVGGSAELDLFVPPRKQIAQSAECTQLYTCGMLDTPVIRERSPAHEIISLTSLASPSTETIQFESESIDVDTGASDQRSTILKCITDNSFLEFLITEGLDLDARSKQGVVEVVMAQYSNKLNRVENTIPKLAAQIRDTEATIGQQTERVKQLQEELESVKGEIVKNESLLRGLINEQREISEHRKALKRKVARCEGTMKNVLGGAKKVRLQ